MTDERDDEVFERRLAAALREAHGERAPDVTAAVLARVAAGEVVDVGAAVPVRSRLAWLAAAAVFLLGLATVLAVAWSQRGGAGGGPNDGEGGAQEAQQPEQPKLPEVTRIGDIATLPRELKAVELRNLEDDAVAALVVRCPDLEHLRVFASTAYKREGDLPAQSITDAALPHIAKLTQLRRLELVGVVLVKGPGLRELAALPRLESLAIEFFDMADEDLAFLERLASLRDLSLVNVQTIGDRAYEIVGRCVGLRALTIVGGRGLGTDSLAPLRSLQHLERLQLHGIGQWSRGVADPETAARFGLGMDFSGRRQGTGVTVDKLGGGWPKLQELALEAALDLESDVGAFVRDHGRGLRRLTLRGCPNVDDTTLADVLTSPNLTELVLGNCPRVTAAVLPKLVAAKNLAWIDFGVTPWLTLAHAEELLLAGKGVRGARPTDPQFEANLRGLVALHARHLADRRPTPQVRTIAEIEALPKATTRIELRGLGDRAATLLARFPDLHHVEFIRDDDDPFTAAGLRAVAALPKLEHLELNNLPNLKAGDLASLRQARSLRSLDLASVAVDDAALQVLPDLPLDTLVLAGVRTFGEDGARAIARCIDLRRLEVLGCDQLSRDAIATFGALDRLETLVLRELPKLSDSALMGLQHLVQLRALEIGPGCFTSMGLQTLADMKRLVVLRLSGNRDVVTSCLLYAPTGLQALQLDECPGIGDDVGTLLRDRFPSLRSLDLGGNAKITDATLAAILQNPSLQRLGLRDCTALTAASFAAIRDARSLRELDATRAPCLTDASAAELQRLRPELKITRKVW
ncbi:MAG: hypothetical protein JNK15_04130 [Planctomycetes bacterium]|nr:hypothetical protein [Planctomycetota bacterium]